MKRSTVHVHRASCLLQRWSRLLACTAAVVTLAGAMIPVASAAAPQLMLAVTDCSQFGYAGDGGGTLHDALDTAFSNSGSTISFACSGTITVPLASAPIQVNNTLTITGVGQSVTLDGGGSAENILHMFEVSASGNLTIDHLTLTNCYNDGSDRSSPYGAALFNNQGTLTVTNSTLSNNQIVNGDGAGLGNLMGTLTVSNSVFSNNSASGTSSDGGGGMFIYTGVTATVTGATFVNNTAGNSGGGLIIIATGNGARVFTSTFLGNHAGMAGGGLASDGDSQVWSSTFSGNSAVVEGGGLEVSSGVVDVTNTTFAGNSAASGGGLGTGCCADILTNVTVTGNSATTAGGGIFTHSGEVTEAINTIVAGNSTGGDCGQPVTDYGYNLTDVGDTSCGFTAGKHDVLTSSPGLAGGLANNGGPTQTIALLPGSPAIDTADLTTCTGALVGGVDQRGEPRASSWGCDIGAFELQLPSTRLFIAGPSLQASGTAVLFAGLVSSDGVAPANSYYCFVFGSGPCPSDAFIAVGQPLPAYVMVSGGTAGVYTLQAYSVDSAGDRGALQTVHLVESSGGTPPPLRWRAKATRPRMR